MHTLALPFKPVRPTAATTPLGAYLFTRRNVVDPSPMPSHLRASPLHHLSGQGEVEPFTLVEGPDAWYAKDYRGREDWINVLNDTHIMELDAAVHVSDPAVHGV